MSTQPAILGIDLGTSSVKAAIFDVKAECIASASAPYETLHRHPGYAEQRPDDWWRATCAAVRVALGKVNVSVNAIGISGQMHGTVLLHADGSWDDAIIWQDRRSAAQAAAITREIGAEQLIALTGSPLAAGFQAATLRWLAENQPERLAAAAKILLPKDWLRWRMTDELNTDPSDAVGTLLFRPGSDFWSEPLLEAAGISEEQLPDVRSPTDVAGWLTEDAAAEMGLPEDLPVIVGAADTPCALLASGVFEETTMLLNLSTGGQLCLPQSWHKFDETGRTHTFRSAFPSESDIGWYQMGATLAAGMALRWLREQALATSLSYDELVRSAADVAVGAEGLLFLPYLVGERTPHMDPFARAAFLGLGDHHDQRHMVRAVLEGATFAAYDAYLAMREATFAPQRIVLAGGGSRSPLWRQIVADVFGLPVAPLVANEQSALGAALLAGEALRWWKAIEQTLDCVHYEQDVLPNADAHLRYMQLHPLFQQAYQVNRALFRQLSEFASNTGSPA